jgi:hypothetical protein
VIDTNVFVRGDRKRSAHHQRCYTNLTLTRRLSEFVEESAGGLQVGGAEALGEPAEDRDEQGRGLLLPALLSPQAGEAHRTAQLPQRGD